MHDHMKILKIKDEEKTIFTCNPQYGEGEIVEYIPVELADSYHPYILLVDGIYQKTSRIPSSIIEYDMRATLPNLLSILQSSNNGKWVAIYTNFRCYHLHQIKVARLLATFIRFKLFKIFPITFDHFFIPIIRFLRISIKSSLTIAIYIYIDKSISLIYASG